MSFNGSSRFKEQEQRTTYKCKQILNATIQLLTQSSFTKVSIATESKGSSGFQKRWQMFAGTSCDHKGLAEGVGVWVRHLLSKRLDSSLGLLEGQRPKCLDVQHPTRVWSGYNDKFDGEGRGRGRRNCSPP